MDFVKFNCKKAPEVISIVGKTNSGKTTLIEKIVTELKKRGYRVGVIKHDVHKFEFDHEGKDTWRINRAGADTVVIASGKKMGMVKKLEHERNIDEIVGELMQDMDIVITEGYKKQDKPKIEVTADGKLLCGENDNLIGVYFRENDKPQNKYWDSGLNIACYAMGDEEKIVDKIEEEIKKDVNQDIKNKNRVADREDVAKNSK